MCGTIKSLNIGYLNTKVEDEILNLVTLVSDKVTK